MNKVNVQIIYRNFYTVVTNDPKNILEVHSSKSKGKNTIGDKSHSVQKSIMEQNFNKKRFSGIKFREKFVC
jgi:hypothetical protein